jgi:hypothetical protein
MIAVPNTTLAPDRYNGNEVGECNQKAATRYNVMNQFGRERFLFISTSRCNAYPGDGRACPPVLSGVSRRPLRAIKP